MKKRFNKYTLPAWMQNIKRVCGPFIIPFCIFQGIRTILLPSIFDVLLLSVLIMLAVGLYFEII